MPVLDNDYVILTPSDMLTRDETWISKQDMIRQFSAIPDALPNDELRAQINNYFNAQLSTRSTAEERRQAAWNTVLQHPELIDYYIRLKEDDGDRAEAISAERVADVRLILINQLKLAISDIESRTELYNKPWTSYEESLERVLLFKYYVENQDGYRLINRAGQPFSKESEVQLFFGLIWCKTDFDVNREPNNGRGPVDFKVSYGAGDKSLIEFKLAGNTNLKKNLENQIEIYEKANRTKKSVKAIICYTAAHQKRVAKILDELNLADDKAIVVIDARSDNKPSASKATTS